MKHFDEMAPKSFRIKAENIPVCGVQISENLRAAFISKLIEEPSHPISWKCLSDSSLNCQIEHEAELLRLTGGGSFRMVYPCVKCMQDVEIEVKISFNARLLPKEEDPFKDSVEFEMEAFDGAAYSGSFNANEPEAIYFEKGVIDLTALLREQFFLEFPEYPSCDCAQVIQPKECDLSVLEANEAKIPEIFEHPFAKLKNWKNQSLN